MKAKRKRLTEKEWQRRERQRAEEQAESRSDSESRQERIKVLRQELPNLARTDKELAETELVRSLVELVHKQDLEINYMRPDHELCKWAKTNAPEELETLKIFHNRELIAALVRGRPRPTAKQNAEFRRRGYKLSTGVGLIEYEFGGPGEAQWRKHSLFGALGSRYEPTCLDKTFAGGAVKMHRSEGPGLQDLFGMERHRFGAALPNIKKGREKWYDYRAVVKIMHRLLSEKPPESKRPRRRKATRLWLSDRSEGMLGSNGIVARRVLTEIGARSDRLAVSDDIRDAFTAVVYHHIAQGMELRLTEDLRNWITPLVRRHLG